MEAPGGSANEKRLLWVDSSRTTSTEYPHSIQGSGPSFVVTPSTESLPTQYTTLSALQGSFIAIQPSANTADYQSLQGYQPVYISGNSFEGIPSDGDFVVTAAGEDGVASSLQVLNSGPQAMQVCVPSWIIYMIKLDVSSNIAVTSRS